MSIKKHIENIKIDDEFIDMVGSVVSITELFRKLGYTKTVSGNSIKLMRQKLIDNDVEFSHFVTNGMKKTGEYRNCKVCGEKFYNVKSKDQQTCSKSCSNILFPRAPISNYRTICFKYHKKKCIFCDERFIVEVHHYDEDNTNNEPKNLIPICPTHHRYVHSRYFWIVKECLEDYYNNFSIRQG